MKKVKIIIVFILFGLSFLAHFTYTLFPYLVTSIFFPVNESVWEHMKIIYTCTIVASIVEYYIYKFKNIKFNNLLISIPTISILGIVIYLSLYYFITMFVSQNMFINISLLLIVYIIMQIISYYILNSKKIKNENIIGLFLIIVCYCIFAYLTYYPIISSLFLDQEKHIYGIIKES